MVLKYPLFIFLAAAFTPVFSQRDTTLIPTPLREVTISKFHVNDSLMNAPASIGILSAADLRRNNLTEVASSMNMIPGVLMQSGALNTNRISIRGIGARTPFGTNKIRAFFGSIPLTSGDSETTIEDINIENIDKAEVIKGPLSSIYGAGLGGAIILTPTVASRGTELAAGSVHGSFGLVKTNLNFSSGGETGSLNLNYHNLETDGWRQNSAYARNGVTVSGDFLRREKSRLVFLANYTYMKAYIPSSINSEMFESNPQAAAPTWLASKGFEQYDTWLAGLSYDFELFGLQNSTSVFGNFKNSNEPRPFDILKQETKSYGARTQLSGSSRIFGRNAQFLFGAEVFRDGFVGATYENLYQENHGNGSLQGTRLTGTDQDRFFYNAFAQVRVPVSGKFEIQTGINVNKTSFSLSETFPADTSFSDRYSYDAVWSPQISLLFKPGDFSAYYISASHGFSLPSIEETLDDTGQVNRDILPESGFNFEAGAKVYLFERALFLQASVYRMQIRDLLVARRIGDDQYVGVNAGKTLHQGIEAEMNFIRNINNIGFQGYFSGTIGKYSFEEFIDGNNDFSGNELTGVPNSSIAAGFTITVSGLYFAADYRWVDSFPIDDGNTVYNDAYSLLNLKTGFRFKLFAGLESHLSAGVNNATDERYASMVLVNASSAGGAPPRYYYPGLPIHFYGSVAFRYRL